MAKPGSTKLIHFLGAVADWDSGRNEAISRLMCHGYSCLSSGLGNTKQVQSNQFSARLASCGNPAILVRSSNQACIVSTCYRGLLQKAIDATTDKPLGLFSLCEDFVLLLWLCWKTHQGQAFNWLFTTTNKELNRVHYKCGKAYNFLLRRYICRSQLPDI